MAKRRKIEAPSAEQLDAYEERFRRETSTKPNPTMAPIAQVSAEAARSQSVEDSDYRVKAARNQSDADNYRRAAADGRVIHSILIDQIQPDVIVRDRTVIDPEEMQELKTSIRAHGVRLPIEVFERREGRRVYALLSGFRRLRAVKELLEETGEERFERIPGLVRDPDALGGGFVAMVEENEIRASLSHFERGRIAVVAAQRGAFKDTETAVAELFKSASKAKRSKIRSFSLIFEELGDLLEHAEGLKERDGLRLAAALRTGGAEPLREALAEAHAGSADAEWAAVEPVVAVCETGAKPAKGGRPKKPAARDVLTKISLPGDILVQAESDAKGFVIRLQGRGVSREALNRALTQIEAALRAEETP